MTAVDAPSGSDGSCEAGEHGRRAKKHLAKVGPPPAVHGRFHPVPTHPVFGGPNVAISPNSRGIESLPREFKSTPRLKSVPLPELDSEELKDAKQKAEKWDRDEEQQLPRTYAP